MVCLRRVKGNFRARFLGEGVSVTAPLYPAAEVTSRHANTPSQPVVTECCGEEGNQKYHQNRAASRAVSSPGKAEECVLMTNGESCLKDTVVSGVVPVEILTGAHS